MGVSQRTSASIGVGMLLAAVLAWAMVPRVGVVEPAPDLQALIPKQFGDWQLVDTGLLQMDLSPRTQEGEEPSMTQPYDQTLMRTYRNSKGESVMLAVAYGRQQRQEIKIHRPELCYLGQGFKVLSRRETHLPYGDGAIPAVRLATSNGRRLEPVTYWMRMGNHVVTDAWQSRLHILKEGLLRRIPDGVLVRVSTAAPISTEALQSEYRLQQEFLLAFLAGVDSAADFFTGKLESSAPVKQTFPLLQRS